MANKFNLAQLPKALKGVIMGSTVLAVGAIIAIIVLIDKDCRERKSIKPMKPIKPAKPGCPTGGPKGLVCSGPTHGRCIYPSS